MAKNVATENEVGSDEFFIEIDDAIGSPNLLGSISLSDTPTLKVPDLRAMYQPSSDRRRKKSTKKKPGKKRAKGKTSSTAGKDLSYKTAARTRRRRQIIYRIDTSAAIRLYANRIQANLAGEHYDRDVTVIKYDALFLKLRPKQELRLHGIRPSQVQVMADGSVAIKLVITEKHEHSYSASYTVDSFAEVQQKVKEGVPGATLGYTSKNPEVLRHILDCLNVHYTESEFSTLVGKLNDSIRYDDQLEQTADFSRRNIFFSKRTSKNSKLLGIQSHLPTHRKGRAKRSAKLLKPEGRV